jgi:hypothetical protein
VLRKRRQRACAIHLSLMLPQVVLPGAPVALERAGVDFQGQEIFWQQQWIGTRDLQF